MTAEESTSDGVPERLRELFPSCETDCTDGCKYGCLGWLHRFDAPSPETPASAPESDLSHDQEGTSSLN